MHFYTAGMSHTSVKTRSTAVRSAPVPSGVAQRGVIIAMLGYLGGARSARVLGLDRPLTLSSVDDIKRMPPAELNRRVAALEYVRLVVGTDGQTGLRRMLNMSDADSGTCIIDLLAHGSLAAVDRLTDDYLLSLLPS